MQFKKHFSQNFLIDQNIIQKIVLEIDPKSDENFLEIGPGAGAITKAILPFCKSIKLIEIDKDPVSKLHENYDDNHKVQIIHNDILKVPFDDLDIIKPIRVIGNLPYNISTPILFHCVKYLSNIKDCVFMLQKEVADRICATNNTDSYGRLSIMLQYYFHPKILFNINPGCFYPKPKVYSTMIKLVPYENSNKLKDEQDFKKIVQNAFSARRKTIANALSNLVSKKDLIDCNIDPKLRPENLNLNDYIKISNYYSTQR